MEKYFGGCSSIVTDNSVEWILNHFSQNNYFNNYFNRNYFLYPEKKGSRKKTSLCQGSGTAVTQARRKPMSL